jgi:hypothetical protein
MKNKLTFNSVRIGSGNKSYFGFSSAELILLLGSFAIGSLIGLPLTYKLLTAGIMLVVILYLRRKDPMYLTFLLKSFSQKKILSCWNNPKGKIYAKRIS